MSILPSWAQLAKGNKVKSSKGWGGGGGVINTKNFIIFNNLKFIKAIKTFSGPKQNKQKQTKQKKTHTHTHTHTKRYAICTSYKMMNVKMIKKP